MVAAVLKDEVKKWEVRLRDNLKLVGTMTEPENNLQIKKETDCHKAMRLESASRMVSRGIGRSRYTATSIKKTCNIRKELKPANNLSETMSSQEQRMWFSD